MVPVASVVMSGPDHRLSPIRCRLAAPVRLASGALQAGYPGELDHFANRLDVHPGLFAGTAKAERPVGLEQHDLGAPLTTRPTGNLTPP